MLQKYLIKFHKYFKKTTFKILDILDRGLIELKILQNIKKAYRVVGKTVRKNKMNKQSKQLP